MSAAIGWAGWAERLVAKSVALDHRLVENHRGLSWRIVDGELSIINDDRLRLYPITIIPTIIIIIHLFFSHSNYVIPDNFVLMVRLCLCLFFISLALHCQCLCRCVSLFGRLCDDVSWPMCVGGICFNGPCI